MNENENTVLYNNKRERERERKRKMSIPYISVLVNACVNTRNIIIINYYYMEGQEIYERKKKEFKRNPNKQICGSCGVWQGGVIIKCPFRTAQRWHCKKEGGSAAAAQ